MKAVNVTLREFDDLAAMRGLSLSYNTIDPDNEDGLVLLRKVAKRLSHKGGGHNKFLESITVELDMTMPRYFWSEFDTYRVGITKQSESTMHTILRRELEQEDFVEPLSQDTLHNINAMIREYSNEPKTSLWKLKSVVPEGFLQRRVVVTNYKVLQNIYQQRHFHSLPEWKYFCKELGNLHYPWYIIGDSDGD